MCTCSFGMAPSTLMVTPEKKTVSSMPVATIMDHVPMKNVMPFEMCQSMANPAVAAATAAAAAVPAFRRFLRLVSIEPMISLQKIDERLAAYVQPMMEI